MPDAAFLDDLAIYGPRSSLRERPSFAAAQAYCERLARRHYENFTVVSWLLPAELRPHFASIYSYCRWSDDLADETAGGEASVALLDWWETELEACYAGQTTHPVYVALLPTIREFQIPIEPFRNLLVAFRQDQNRKRYETFNELLDYCRNSANPVGRLVLYLGRCHDEERGHLADSVCTGLQLANFWQDVARDYAMGRVYLPQASCHRVGYTEEMFARHEFNPPFRQLLSDEVNRAESFLRAGQPLVALAPRQLQFDVQLFIDGGLAILKAIRKVDYNVWRTRPVVGKAAKLGLAMRAWWRSRGLTKSHRSKPSSLGIESTSHNFSQAEQTP
jgi:squalene synthase HpnC